MLKWIKYYCIIAKATLTNKTMVYMFGSVYIVSGNVVKSLEDNNVRLVYLDACHCIVAYLAMA